MSEDIGSSSQDSHVAMQMAKPGAGASVGGGGDRMNISVEINKFGGQLDLGFGGNLSDSLIPQGGAMSGGVFDFADRMGDSWAPFKFSESSAMPPLSFEHADLGKTSFQENSGIGIGGKTSLFAAGEGQQH